MHGCFISFDKFAITDLIIFMLFRKKKKSKSGKKKSPSAKPVLNSKRNDQIKIIVGYSLLAFSLYLTFAFVSFLFNAEADQSKLHLSWSELIRNASINVNNITGKTGAYLADVFINRWFGLPSFLLIYLLVLYAFWILKSKSFKLKNKIIKSLILIVWLSIALGFAFGHKYTDWSVYPGGSYGFHVSIWFNSLIGQIGTFFVLLITLIAFIILSFDKATGFFFFKSRKKEISEDKSVKNSDNEEAILEEDDTDLPEALNDEFGENVEEKPAEEILETLKVRDEVDLDDLPLSEEEAIEEAPVQFSEEKEEGPSMTVENAEESEEEVENEPLADYDPKLDLSHYEYPSIDLLETYSHMKSEVTDEELIENKNKIVETLRNFKIEIVKIKATIGPTVTLYEIVPAQGIRISKIKNLEDDIALSLAALGIRIIAPIPGKGTIGIEVPNRTPQMVSMRSIIASRKFQESTAELPVAMGRTVSNETFVFDLTKMPHLLVAGATGQGKSVGLNAIIASILFKKHPSQVKFVFIDPKKVELNLYSIIENHFLAKLPDAEEPIITDVEKVKATLNSLGVEMDARYDLLKSAHARNIKEYNKKFIERKLNPEKGHQYLPYIVVVVDEFADLIMTAGKEIELPIARIAQLARAVGIHMIIATQRPSTNIITGVIKANFPSRIAFKVASMIDSRTILDAPGANQLIGKGDMLFAAGSDMVRLQCAFVDTHEVEGVCQHIADQQAYPTAFLLPEYVSEDGGLDSGIDLQQRDEVFEDAARLVVLNQQGSTSMIQRKFSIGYNRAGRIMDQLEAAGIVGPSEGSKARKVLYQDEYSLEQLLNSL